MFEIYGAYFNASHVRCFRGVRGENGVLTNYKLKVWFGDEEVTHIKMNSEEDLKNAMAQIATALSGQQHQSDHMKIFDKSYVYEEGNNG